MKGFFDTAQKRNEFSSSFGRYRDGICESFSRLRVVGNILLSAQKYNLLKNSIGVLKESKNDVVISLKTENPK